MISNGIMERMKTVIFLERHAHLTRQMAASRWKKAFFPRDGFAVLDDSKTILLTEDGWVKERKQTGEDFYLFAYGHDYRGAVRGFPESCRASADAPEICTR